MRTVLQNREELRSLPYLLTQFSRPSVCALHFRGDIPLIDIQWLGRVQFVKIILVGRAPAYQAECKELDALGEMMDRFHIGRALGGSLPARCQYGIACAINPASV